MDLLEKINRRFGSLYENLFAEGGAGGKAGATGDLRPREILRRILQAMEDRREQGMDGAVYVPNVYSLDVVVSGDEERDYVRTFLSDAELRDALREKIGERTYKTKGALKIEVREMDSTTAPTGTEAVRIRCRFDASQRETEAVVSDVSAATNGSLNNSKDDEEEPATVPLAGLFGGAGGTLAALIVRTPGKDAETYPVSARGLKIGRSQRMSNDIVFADDTQVSKEHLLLRRVGDAFFAEDLGSTNGTLMNGNRMIAHNRVPLSDGDTMRIGQTELRFRLTNAPTSAAVPPLSPASTSNFVPPQIVQPTSSTSPSTFAFGLADGRRLPLRSGALIGTGVGAADVVLPAAPGLAERHARFLVRDGMGHIEDLGTPGGTFVNDVRLPAHFPVTLYNGNQIRLGDAAVLEYIPQNAPHPPRTANE